MPGKGLVDKVVAAAIAVACVFVAIVALGATLFYLLLMVVPAAAAAAITAAVAAVGALIIAVTFLNKAKGDDEEEEEPAGLGQRAFVLFRNRPVLATVAALAGGWIFLRNPALASMVAAVFTESSRGRRR
ncbi:hypothetical protein IWC96_14095 [Brevundimonas sp. BAL450]|uniref:Uncharacterized protein n=1 Tax=Brevundimonas abyssalis TAR-001 TaxID=1391729 RepID=A0A8E0KL30_9CAUL|nr:hypothetical protein [Brevundimonas sp. BAL450]GAD58367.1 hypothetical protein MBEBAB_0617 [Brevundimonas abyssalis TAR-001]